MDVQTTNQARGIDMSEIDEKLPWYKRQPPAEGQPVSDILGKRPRLVKLNDELIGKTIKIVKVTPSEGDKGTFVILGAFLDNEAITLVTGATDIVERVLPLMEAINDGAVVTGTLKKIGRKWLFE